MEAARATGRAGEAGEAGEAVVAGASLVETAESFEVAVAEDIASENVSGRGRERTQSPQAKAAPRSSW